METATQGFGLGIHAVTHGPHCMKIIGWCPSLRVTVADRPNTYLAPERRAANSKLNADR
jgi:hypothetical protein